MRKDIHNSDIPLICKACEARHKGICGALDEEQLLKLNRHTSQHRYENGTELVAPEEEVHRYSNIMRGVVKLTKLLADGRQQIVGLQFAPDFLGRPFKAQSDVIADAATDVEVCSFPRKALEEMIATTPGLEHKLYEQTLRELDEARDWMLTLGRKTAAEKVATFLYLIASHIDPDIDDLEGPVTFDLPLKRGEIADFLGLTIETVSRQITKLRKAGVIEVENNRRVVVPRMARLRTACEVEH